MADSARTVVVWGMRILLLLAVALAVRVAGATVALPSVEGLVFHDSYYAIGQRYGEETIVSLGRDGRYSFLKRTGGSILQGPTMTVYDLPRDGTYTYAVTGPATATLVLRDPSGTLPHRDDTWSPADATVLTLTLTFTSERAGANFYFTDPTALKPMSNISLRGAVDSGRPLIVGFVVPGSTPPNQYVDVLVRVVGLSLSTFGVANAWEDPEFTLYSPAGGAHFYWTDGYVGNWSQTAASKATFERLAAAVGAFPLQAGAKDAVSVMRLRPGAYTIIAGPKLGTGGDTLVELYVLP